MKKFPQVQFEVNWRPFQLQPEAPKEGRNKLEMYHEKFGADRVRMMMPRLTQAFDNVGVKFSMGGMTGNTFDSHRLIYWAGTKGKQDELMEELFMNYFSQEKYIGDPQVLEQAAEKVGLDRQEAAGVISNPQAFAKEVEAEKKKFGRSVSGVPFFIINGEEGLSGAQPPEVFEQVFREVLD
ncbi:hypothetical protein GUITHDRAFT_117897 [Guillardia theta CCMP2712]|uniref:DSBA-like thioredoxin domain-containing protein n=1 Tax=Guillardia theta (strain CCMP2712) TaxID=905079 RepID=L1IIQ6_GUITC|nr:hypothetical protein GUITHDRAFT_117897 [Guillardia theta CCMP2712]EKX35982.1 hypothetical protein GUITHDRAFT_117897 [Guillardia theta CCMP2712]|mmetsp:Transcript_44565/g.140614  ORF Transcript_44565/g.140614 Transcript_44565/m.140614 type:complete len:181 (-) Transcript_44565:2135-2677(-)|eukprot:XP_005822962.1 hypothetical protein GUITHDRAFT_117897 [Guillardia theta CCMP2712]